MPTLIPCADIQAAIKELQAKFEPCYALTADDLDQILNLIYSVSLCSAGTIDQDNIFKTKFIATLEKTETLTLSDVASAVNTATQFTVGEKELMIFAVDTLNTSSGPTTITGRGYYLLKNVGAGTYGAGGTSLTADNIFWLRDDIGTIIVNTNENPVFYELTTAVPGNLDTPAAVINAAVGPYAVVANTDYYFRIRLFVGAEKTTTYKLYRYTGALGTFGTAGGSTANEIDFELVENSTSIGEPSGTTVTNYVLSTILNDVTNIEDAVNAEGPFVVESNELVSFQANYVSATSDKIQSINLKYFWTQGAKTIDGAAVADDFLEYERQERVDTVPVITANPPEVRTVTVGNLDNPEVGVNNSTETYIIDGTADWYFYTVYSNKRQKGSPTYKLWRWIGTNGTYGNAGATAVNGDFVLVHADGETPVGAIEATGFERIDLGGGNFGFRWIGESGHETFGPGTIDGAIAISPTGLVGASDDGSVVFGINAYSMWQDSVIIGTNARSESGDSVVIGSNAEIINGGGSGSYTGTVVGAAARINAGIESIAIGTRAGRDSAGANNAIFIGYNAGSYSGAGIVTSTGSVSIGAYSEQLGNGVTIGYAARGGTASGENSIAIGNNANTGSLNAIAIGNFAGAVAAGSISVGNRYIGASNGVGSVAIGNYLHTITPAYGEVVLGTFPALSTPTNVAAHDPTDRALTFGVGASSGAKVTGLGLLKSGQFQLPVYGSGTFTGTLAYGLGTDASGNVIEYAPGDVTKVGTPADSQIGVWTGDGTIEGDTDFQWQGGQRLTIGSGHTHSGGQYSIVSGTNNTLTVNASASFVTGTVNDVRSSNSIVVGTNNQVDIATAGSSTNAVFGAQNEIIGLRDYNFIAGRLNVISFIETASDIAVLIGDSNTAGTTSAALGYGMSPQSFREIALGSYGTTYSPTSRIAMDNADRILTVGIGATPGSRADGLRMFKDGSLDLPSYGSGTFTGTETYYLAVDSSGNVIEKSVAQAGNLKYAEVTLNATQIKNRGTTPITVVTNPGGDTLLTPVRVIYTTDDLTGFDGNPINLAYGTGKTVTFDQTPVSDNGTGDGVYMYSTTVSGDVATAVNQDLEVTGVDSTASGGGDIVVGVYYTETPIDVPGVISDENLKDNIKVLNTIDGVEFVSWTWNEEAARLGHTGSGFGVIAQQVQTIIPEAVYTGSDGYLRVRYDIVTDYIAKETANV